MSKNIICLLQVKNYSLQNNKQIPFDDFSIKFKTEYSESGFKLNKYTTDNASMKLNTQNVNQEVKFLITIQNDKTHSLIGISNFSIPKSKLKNIKNGNSVTHIKECSLIMTDLTKKKYFGNKYQTNTISITIEAECKSILNKNNIMTYKNKFHKGTNVLSPKMEGNQKPMWLKLENYLKKEFNAVKTPPASCIKNHKGYFDIDNNNNSGIQNNNKKINYSFGYLSNSNRKQCNKKSNSFSCKSPNANTSNYNSNSYKIQNKTQLRVKQNNYTVIYKINKSQIKHKNKSTSPKRGNPLSRGIKLHNSTNKNKLNINVSDDNINNNSNIKVNKCNLYECNQSPINAQFRKQCNNIDNVIQQIENEINDIPVKINSLYINNNTSNNNPNLLRSIVIKQIQNLITYQKLYTNKITQCIHENKHLQLTLKSICTQYKTSLIEKSILFQDNHLTQINSFVLQSQNIKHNLYDNLIQTTQNEVKLFQHIFSKFYSMKHHKHKQIYSLSQNEKLYLLLACARNIINTYGTFTNLIHSIPQHIKSKVKSLFIKNNIQEVHDLGMTNNQFLPSKIKAITEEDENEEDDNEDMNGYTSQIQEDDEEIIEKAITELNYTNRKKGSNILFKKIKGNYYLYGEQQLKLKIEEGKNIQVIQQGNNSKGINLFDFIKNKPLSNFNHNKLQKIINNSLKSKDNSCNKSNDY